MKRLPRNERRTSPRPVRIDGGPSRRRSDRAPAPVALTPTPPPVAVSYAPLPEPADEPPPSSLAPAITAAALERNETVAARVWLALLAVAAVVVTLVVQRSLAGQADIAVSTWRDLIPLTRAAMVHTRAPAFAEQIIGAKAPAGPRADARLRRSGYESIRGGVLYAPATFSSEDGAYDLLLHFHGNVKVVVESAEVAKLNAAVAVINLGVGSAPYQDAYAEPGSYEALLEDIDRALGTRGLTNGRLRRVAVSGWSAGYGAISTVLDQRRGTDPLDAVLVLDGIHCGFLEERPDALNPLQLGPFAKAAKKAATGEILFSITHSQIDPMTYASSTATAGYLADLVGAEVIAADPEETLPHLELVAARGAVSKKLEKKLLPTTEARAGLFHVRGFRGETREDHMAHLLQMGATVLPELARRWAAPPP